MLALQQKQLINLSPKELLKKNNYCVLSSLFHIQKENILTKMRAIILLWPRKHFVIDQYQCATGIWDCSLKPINITGSQDNTINGV